MPPTKTAPIGSTPLRIPNPLKAFRERRQLAAFTAANQARIGSPLDAINHALTLNDRAEIALFLEDWQAGSLASWPEYRPTPPATPTLTPGGRLIRAAALLSGFMGGLLFAAGFYDAALSPTPSDPIKNVLTLAWAASVLVCAAAAWRGVLHHGES